jgi:mannose-6-phosphate isomerase-like protein (cupin superfamily)
MIVMTDLPGGQAPSFVLPAGGTRREGAMLPFKLLAKESGGLISVCEFTLPGWASGPVLHRHEEVDEGFFVVSGRLEFQLDDARVAAGAGDFGWVPRGTAHTFACASPDPVHVVSFAVPGGVEDLFAEQWEYLSSLTGAPDPSVLDSIGSRHGAPTLGPPIIASNAPA